MVLQINAMERWLCFLGGEWWIAERERERDRVTEKYQPTDEGIFKHSHHWMRINYYFNPPPLLHFSLSNNKSH
jgi:hypothetical protein